MEKDDMTNAELRDRIVIAMAQVSALGEMTQYPVSDTINVLACAYAKLKDEK